MRWKTVAENVEMVADQPRAADTRVYAITMAEKLNPAAELVIDDDSED